MPTEHNNIAENLRYLCTFHDSVAAICRRIAINRQQFNKYLSGESQPSLHNLRKITDFFGIDEFEIMLPREAFVELVAARREARAAGADTGQLMAQLFARLGMPAPASHTALQQYLGHYAVYFSSPVWSSHVVRSLTTFYQDGQITYSKGLERLNPAGKRQRSKVVQKFRGTVMYIHDRIYVLEYESASVDLVALTILYPSHRKQRPYLTGIILTIASGGNRQPFASRVVYEYLGSKIDLRAELDRCRLYPMDSDEIPEDILNRIGNNADPSDEVLLPRSF